MPKGSNNYAGAAALLASVLLVCAAVPGTAGAYATWAEGCNVSTCHGDYNSGTYVSKSDATSWGTDLMTGHINFMGTSACDICHQPPGGTPRSPVYIGISAGITGYSPIACLGCHGRSEDANGICVSGTAGTIVTANCGMGSGLRRHHANAGVALCATCHTASPAVGESVPPPYYFADAARPSKPLDACNLLGAPSNENKFGLAGLDNDGDGLRDIADPDCVDGDGDGILNGSDNCTLIANANQLDADGDRYGNICDADLDNNGLVTAADYGLLRSVLNRAANSSPVAAAADMNGDGFVTAADYALLRARLNTAPGPSGLHQ